jgi:hypothetical protein
LLLNIGDISNFAFLESQRETTALFILILLYCLLHQCLACPPEAVPSPYC